MSIILGYDVKPGMTILIDDGESERPWRLTTVSRPFRDWSGAGSVSVTNDSGESIGILGMGRYDVVSAS